MEMENNSNLELQSGTTNNRTEMMNADKLFNITPDVTGVSSDVFPAVTFTGVSTLDSAAETESSLNPSRFISEGGFTQKSVDERVNTYEVQNSMNYEHLEDAAELVTASEKDITDSDNLQDNGEINFRAPSSFGLRQTDNTVNETQNYTWLLDPHSHNKHGDAILSDSSFVSQTLHTIPQMDTYGISEPASQSSEINNKEEGKGNEKNVESENFDESAGNIFEINEPESLQKLGTGVGASTFCEEDIDFLEEESQDGANQTGDIVSFGMMTDDRVSPTVSDHSRISKLDELGVSSYAMEVVNDGNRSEVPLEMNEQRSDRTVTSIAVPESYTRDTIESMEADEMMTEEGNSIEELSKNLLAQPNFASKKCENAVKEVLHEEPPTYVMKKSETLEFSNLSETDIPRHNVCDDYVKETDASASEKIAVNAGTQGLDINICHEDVGTKMYDTAMEHSLQVTDAISEDAAPEVIEPECLNDGTVKVTSFSNILSKNISSSEFTKRADTSVHAVHTNENNVRILNTDEDNTEHTSSSLPENPALAIELVSANMPQLCTKSNVDLLTKDAVASNVGLEEADATKENNQTSDETYICESADGETPDKSASLQNSSEFTTECDLETENAESITSCRESSNSGTKLSMKSNGSLSKDTRLAETVGTSCYNDDNSEDLMEISEIKTEPCASDLNESAWQSSVLHKKRSLRVIKQELNAGGSEEDVIIIDDEGEFVQLKKEAFESNTAENGLDIQISGISGQQHQLHASAEKASVNSVNKADSSGSQLDKSKMTQSCIVCKKITKCKYNIVRNWDIKHLCDDACFRQFRIRPSVFLKQQDTLTTPNISSVAVDTGSVLPLKDAPAVFVLGTGSRPDIQYKTCAVCQLMNVNIHQPFCNWKGLDFCGETCLGKFQANLNTSCSFCRAYIPLDMRTTFCLKIGNDMRPFCKQKCYNEFKKKLRLCSFCQRDIAAVPMVFSTQVGSDGKFKEFCSQDCMKKLESQINDVEILSVEKGNLELETIMCSVCEKQGPMKFTVRLKGKANKLCSELCLSAFQYTNKINVNKCDSCNTTCTTEEAKAHFVQYEGKVKYFCSDLCVSRFRTSFSKVVPCGWCNTKKLNFDMIERLDVENKLKMFCSLTCLSLFRVNLQAKSNQAVPCDQCQKVVPAQYHLTMSDASVLNFCSYQCVMTFQTQFSVKRVSPGYVSTQTPSAATPAQDQQQVTAELQTTPGSSGGRGGRMVTRQVSKQQSPTCPIISNVVSLAPTGAGDSQAPSLVVQPLAPPQQANSLDAATGMKVGGLISSGDGKHQIVIQAAPPKYGKNKALQCRPLTQTKATSCRPHSQNKEVQTDEVVTHPMIIPIPVPVYIPMPTVMFSAPAPKFVPFPIPIPVPIFIPTTRKSVSGISKTIQEIVERIPADPYEAELLMMAEAVAADKTAETSDSETEADVEDFGIPVESEDTMPIIELDELPTAKKGGENGDEDMLQMALRMAEEMAGPMEDLETSVQLVAVSAEPPGQQQKTKTVQTNNSHDDEDDDTDYSPPQALRSRAVKRAARGRPPSSRNKRQRLGKSYNDEDSMQAEPLSENQFVVSPPDSKYRLKFTYGVNAWRHWAITKNMQIEKSNSLGITRGRPFPTDILKSTMDELNMSLCMFVNDARKPSGQEYSPDSIYYLCLGLQQYLYENGRIDSVFTDMYFEKFTENLHIILKDFEPKVNTRGQMLCRIEEEHLWESKQLGAHSPFVLLNTLIYFHTKHFILRTIEEHMALSFAQILKHWKKGMSLKGQTSSTMKNVSLRFYCLVNGKKENQPGKKSKEGVPVFEVTENLDNPLRCPVKLYEFFLSKCPESIKNRNDIFYPIPERSCVPDSPVWYSTLSLDHHNMDKMLTRILLVREIQEAILHAQPIYL